jgi:NAD(P)-dependent dehydrogenase (short-subunit alcohol dehydrogenase family)
MAAWSDQPDIEEGFVMALITLVTGASSGFGQMMARALAHAGHTVYASMRDTKGRNAAQVEESDTYAAREDIDLKTAELDVQDETSIRAAVDVLVKKHGRIDILVQNAGHMVFGPTEAFTPEQLAELYDVNVLGAQRVMRAVMPVMRAARSGLVIWTSSSSTTGGVPPYLGPYFAAKAGMDALAVCYAKELALFGIETSIVVPGAYTKGTNHFAHSGTPADKAVERAYTDGLPANFSADLLKALADTVPEDADPAAVGRALVDIVAMPYGTRPLRVVIDPASDGAIVSFAVIDRIRAEFLHRIGHPEMLHPVNPVIPRL